MDESTITADTLFCNQYKIDTEYVKTNYQKYFLKRSRKSIVFFSIMTIFVLMPPITLIVPNLSTSIRNFVITVVIVIWVVSCVLVLGYRRTKYQHYPTPTYNPFNHTLLDFSSANTNVMEVDVNQDSINSKILETNCNKKIFLSDIDRIQQTKDYINLITKSGVHAPVKKDSFIKGSLDEFLNFLNLKCQCQSDLVS